MGFKFTSDWFSNNIERWSKFVIPHLESRKGPIKTLEVGVYEGRSALWTLENGGLLKHPKSQMWLVDNWKRRSIGSKRSCWWNFINNLRVFKEKHHDIPDDKVMIRRGHIPTSLKSPEILKQQFDFIYLDLAGSSQNMLETVTLAWALLKRDGMLIIDDYTSNKYHDGACMKQGIDAFLDIYAYDLKVVHMSWQVILKKRVKPLQRREKCHSEYYDAST